MRDFVILADNGCALEKNLRERFHVEDVVFGNVFYPDGHSEKADLDWERSTPEEYFGSMVDKKVIYKTACPNIDEIKEMFIKYAKQGTDILMITLSTGVSAIYGFALKAAEEVKAEYKDIKIEVIDSLRYSTSYGMELMYASKLKEEGKSLEEVASWIKENRNCFHQIGIMDDLFWLSRNGRISKAAAFMGNLIGVEPMADFSDKGLAEVIGKGKGKRKTMQICLNYLKETIVDAKEQTVFICHSLREKEALLFKEMLEKEVGPKEIIISTVDQTCGANIGPGLAAMFYFGKPISADLVEEKKIMSGLLK